MQPTTKILPLTILCALFVVSSGCQQRYKPSQWKAAKRLSASEAQSEMDTGSKPEGAILNGANPDGLADGGFVSNPWSTMPGRGVGGSTLPGRGWSTLPGRGWSTLPGRGWSTVPNRSWSTLPGRAGSTLPQRGWSPLPARDWSTIPTRGESTLPVRGREKGLRGLEMPQPLVDPARPLDLPKFTPLRGGSTLPSRLGNPLR